MDPDKVFGIVGVLFGLAGLGYAATQLKRTQESRASIDAQIADLKKKLDASDRTMQQMKNYEAALDVTIDSLQKETASLKKRL